MIDAEDYDGFPDDDVQDDGADWQSGPTRRLLLWPWLILLGLLTIGGGVAGALTAG